MKLNEVEIGKPIQIILILDDRRLEFDTVIQEIVGESVLVEPITDGDKTVGFKNHDALAVYVGPDKKPYGWSNVQVKLVKYQDKVFHQLVTNVEGSSLNRRGAYRQYVGHGGVVMCLGKKYRAIIKDVSTNGCGFVCDEEFTIGDNVVVAFTDEEQDFTIHCTIVRKYTIPENGKTVYGCKTHTVNRKIEKYIMERQRQDMLRKKT